VNSPRGDVEKLTAWLVRQTGVRLDTLRQHYEKWWPRDQHAIAATHAVLDPTLLPAANKGRLQPVRLQIGKNP